MNYQISSALLGSALGITILLLVRRDHLQLAHALFWLAFAGASILFGLIPGLSDKLAAMLGISYGPTLVILVAVAALVLRSLQADIHNSRLERSTRRIAQRLAILESDLDKLRSERSVAVSRFGATVNSPRRARAMPGGATNDVPSDSIKGPTTPHQ